MSDNMKSFKSQDPLVKYTVDHSLRLTDVQKRLMEATFQLCESDACMLGAPEILQLNANLIQAIGGKKVLDIGVFTGASSLAAALALPPDGAVHALDINEDFTNIGKVLAYLLLTWIRNHVLKHQRPQQSGFMPGKSTKDRILALRVLVERRRKPFWREAGVEHKVHLHLGPAADTLQRFIDQGLAGTFDFAFIDADKSGYDTYYEKCLVLIRRGGIIAFDNTLQGGRVLDTNDQKLDTVAIRKLNEKLKEDQHVSSITQGCLQQEGNDIEEPEALSLQEKVKVLARMDAGASMGAICAEFDIKSSTFYPFTAKCSFYAFTLLY
ncbi:putative caffeoyl-CoA O-methyltransferase 1 [Chionoecetes opilio]|uniref:Putative caffeoyl-CoA O-methyltransferase 1 n=1 Tax=Chionoecetes opilio TaxID=41210 RepID=A0A8J4Y9G1_CHIOP|nr:putative caffeoyl-CoA O-methyltransferase 1 [Chionoecetes opilio]